MRNLLIIAVFLAHCAHARQMDPATGEVDSNKIWYAGSLFTVEGKGWTNTENFYERLPFSAKGTVPDRVWWLAKHTSGIALRFSTDAKIVSAKWELTKADLDMPHMPSTSVSGLDLYGKKGSKYHFIQNLSPSGVLSEKNLRLDGSEEYLLYLPLYNGVKNLELGFSENSIVSAPDLPIENKSIVFYGTSITQGGVASRPGLSATAITGRKLNAEIINLGFSGAGKMEIEMADILAELSPAVFVIDCGRNLTPQEISDRTGPFVKKLRKNRPKTPIVPVEDSNLSNEQTARGAALQKEYDRLQTENVPLLYYLPNGQMLGDDGEATVDGIHLNDLGMMRQAEVFTQVLKTNFFNLKTQPTDPQQKKAE